MNRRGFFAALLAPLVVPFTEPDRYFRPTYFWPPDDFYTGQYLILDGQVRQITGYVARTKVVTLQARMNALYQELATIAFSNLENYVTWDDNETVDNVTLNNT